MESFKFVEANFDLINSCASLLKRLLHIRRKSGNTVESFKFVEANFVVCRFFTGSWRRNFVDWLVWGGVRGVERKDNYGKVDFI